jgi:hypothetical protein
VTKASIAISELYGKYMPISPIWVMRSIKEKESLQIVAEAGQAMPIMELTSSRNSASDIRAAGGFAIAGKCIFIYLVVLGIALSIDVIELRHGSPGLMTLNEDAAN